ncbi:hypothetical protein [Aurantimicrobium minutum]|uniref:hypothetical protein n=1 Tax=Aurantimicrobium minutum TaxID=708131 RepID=UPI0024753952|nr:hypothetical protein [Aurantimicrobium minutum]MDH6536945.1 hypothetical protein [Aurantimicrobium minutum]
MDIFFGLLLFGGLVLIIWGFFAFLFAMGRALTGSTPPVTQSTTDTASDEIDGMNNGDYYNGPHGYSPMTGYPETQYGSGFDPDAEWNHEEHD